MTEFKEGDLVRISIPPPGSISITSHTRQLLDGRTGLVVKKIERASFQGGGTLFHVFLGPAPNMNSIQTIGATWLELVSETEDDRV